VTAEAGAGHDWWRRAVVYQVYLRSFADGDGDGQGDLAGLRSRLGYLADLGVDALWINPWYPSPLNDGGYDVADYRDIHPAFGTLGEAEAMLADAHALGLRVLADIVPNHTSDQHVWFQQALAAGPGSRERARYWFADGRGPDGSEPPNDWPSTFGGRAWSRVTEADGRPGQWYLHLFDSSQPDLNWGNPEVVEEFLDVLAFWFDRGVDGFRIDVGHGLAKNPLLPDLGVAADPEMLLDAPDRPDHPFWDRPEVHEVYRGWRALGDRYDPPRVFVGEVWLDDPTRLALYLRPDELHTSFAFELTDPDWDPTRFRGAIDSAIAAATVADAPVTWVLSNHDLPRHVSRYGRSPAVRERFGAHAYDFTDLDVVLGRRRARAAALLSLALPGGVYLYQGEELGLEEVLDIPEHQRDDPIFRRSGGSLPGRDGCRVPLPWQPSGPSLGFGTGQPWLPQPAGWQALAASVQHDDPQSMLSLYRAALALRRAEPALQRGGFDWRASPPDVLSFVRGAGGVAPVLVLVNMGAEAVPLPPGEVLLASGPAPQGVLPEDAATWLRPHLGK
jgi:alpha-glucosidase